MVDNHIKSYKIILPGGQLVNSESCYDQSHGSNANPVPGIPINFSLEIHGSRRISTRKKNEFLSNFSLVDPPQSVPWKKVMSRSWSGTGIKWMALEKTASLKYIGKYTENDLKDINTPQKDRSIRHKKSELDFTCLSSGLLYSQKWIEYDWI